MVKHIVLFKLKTSLSVEEKLEYMRAFKSAIEALPVTIPFIRNIFVGFNINEAEHWDLCLESEFDTLDEAKAYTLHPEHVKAAAILKEVKVDRACTDYVY